MIQGQYFGGGFTNTEFQAELDTYFCIALLRQHPSFYKLNWVSVAGCDIRGLRANSRQRDLPLGSLKGSILQSRKKSLSFHTLNRTLSTTKWFLPSPPKTLNTVYVVGFGIAAITSSPQTTADKRFLLLSSTETSLDQREEGGRERRRELVWHGALRESFGPFKSWPAPLITPTPSIPWVQPKAMLILFLPSAVAKALLSPPKCWQSPCPPSSSKVGSQDGFRSHSQGSSRKDLKPLWTAGEGLWNPLKSYAKETGTTVRNRVFSKFMSRKSSCPEKEQKSAASLMVRKKVNFHLLLSTVTKSWGCHLDWNEDFNLSPARYAFIYVSFILKFLFWYSVPLFSCCQLKAFFF